MFTIIDKFRREEFAYLLTNNFRAYFRFGFRSCTIRKRYNFYAVYFFEVCSVLAHHVARDMEFTYLIRLHVFPFFYNHFIVHPS